MTGNPLALQKLSHRKMVVAGPEYDTADRSNDQVANKILRR